LLSLELAQSAGTFSSLEKSRMLTGGWIDGNSNRRRRPPHPLVKDDRIALCDGDLPMRYLNNRFGPMFGENNIA
jgi:hypothetical protein